MSGWCNESTCQPHLSSHFFDHLTKGFSLPLLLNGPKDLFPSSGLLFLQGEKLNAALGVHSPYNSSEKVCTKCNKDSASVGF